MCVSTHERTNFIAQEAASPAGHSTSKRRLLSSHLDVKRGPCVLVLAPFFSCVCLLLPTHHQPCSAVQWKSVAGLSVNRYVKLFPVICHSH